MSANTSKAEATPEAPAIRTVVAPYAYSAGQSYFQKFTAPHLHILPVRFHRFTAMDGGGSILAMFCREEKLETQNRTRMSDFEYLIGKMCELKADKPGGSKDCCS